MDPRILRAEISPEPVDPAELLALVASPVAGASTLFVGQVRNHDTEASGEVVALTYSCHPSAPQRIVEIVEAVLAAADPDSQARVATCHRTGRLVVGDPAFVVAAAAPHRELAFTVCRLVVEQVKRELPVWKQQFTADGGYAWPGMT